MVIWVIKTFLYSSSVYSCHFLVSSASFRSIPFLSFIVAIFAWNVPLVSLIFLKRSLIFLYDFLIVNKSPKCSTCVQSQKWQNNLFSEIIAKTNNTEWFYCFPLFLCIDRLRRLYYVSLLFFGTLHSDRCIFPFLLYLSLLFFSQLFVRPPQKTILPFFSSFSWRWSWSLPLVQCHEPPSTVLQVLYQM